MVTVKRNKYRGFTLAEAVMATVVLGIAAAGVLLPFTSGLATRTEGERRTLAAELAGDLIEKIISDHSKGIDITAKYNYTEPEGQVKDASGTVFTDLNYAGFSREVSCANAYVPQESGTGKAKFICATVRVYYKGRETANIERLISK